MDEKTPLAELRQVVREFVDERNWQKFHTPKNISMALAIEAAELMEHFQWLEPEASRQVAADAEKCAAVGEEIADVFCYLLALANELDLDLSQAFTNKMAKNRVKYPAAEIRGRWGHDDPNPVEEA